MTTARLERTRQALHMAMGGFALLLRDVPWWGAAMIAAGALILNVLVLPVAGGVRLYRPSEHRRGYSVGIVLYPLAVLLLVCLFPSRPDIAAAAWGVLAIGDGMATVAGTHLGGPRIPWNRKKSVAGSLALFACGGAAAAFLAWWCRPAIVPLPPLWFSLGVPFAAAAAAAFAESIPVRLDDNLTVPITAAGVLWCASLMQAPLIAAAAVQAIGLLPIAAALNAVAAASAYRARSVSISGAIAGGAIGILMFVTLGWRGWLLLMLTFLAATVTSRVGLRRKTLLGIAEERGGRRGAGNAIANTGIAAMAALLAVTTAVPEAALTAFVAALTAGGSDTVASEIGKAFGRHTWTLHHLGAVPPGTPGAVSLEGTSAGLLAALALGSMGVALQLAPPGALVAVVAGATAGAFAESALSTAFEERGLLNNDILNFLNTGIAAATAMAIARWA